MSAFFKVRCIYCDKPNDIEEEMRDEFGLFGFNCQHCGKENDTAHSKGIE
jgi:hypothetical protein